MRVTWSIVFVAFVLRLGAATLVPIVPVQNDTAAALAIGQNLRDGWGFSLDLDEDGIPEATTRDPGYPAMFATFSGLHLPPVTSASTFQIIASALAVVAVSAIANATLPGSGNFVAGAYAVFPALVMESPIVSPESLLIPLVLFSAAAVMRAVATSSMLWWVAAGCLFGSAVLIKQVALPVGIAFCAGAVIARPTRRIAIGIVTLAVAAGLIYAPWLTRNRYVQQRFAELTNEFLPEISQASSHEIQSVGERVTATQLNPYRYTRSLETTIRARVVYDFRAGDPRRGAPLLSGSGGEADALVAKPSGIAGRIAMNLKLRTVANTLGIPYENRLIDAIFPATPRLREWRASGQNTPGVFIKIALTALLALLHVGTLIGAVLLVRRRFAAPLLLGCAALYATPLLHSSPLNRFFLPAVPFALLVAAIGVTAGAARRLHTRGVRPKMIYVLPHYDPASAEHFAHVTGFLEAVAKSIDVAVIVERGNVAPSIAGAARVDMLPKGWRPVARMLAMAAVLVPLRVAGYRKIFIRISIPSALVAGTIGRALGIESYYWNSGQGKNTAPSWKHATRRRALYELKLLPFYAVTKIVHHFVTGPEGMDAYYAREYGVSRRKILLFANDVDVAAFQSKLVPRGRAGVREKLGLLPSDRILLFVGRVSELKGGEYLLPIAERVLPAYQGVVMVIVGAVHLKDFRAALADHPLRDRIKMAGEVANAQIAALYGESEVFLLPSNSEGFPRVLLESMAAALPFVAFDVGGVRRIADPLHAPYIVPRGDIETFCERVRELLDDQAARVKLGDAGTRRVARYDTSEVAKMFVERIACA